MNMDDINTNDPVEVLELSLINIGQHYGMYLLASVISDACHHLSNVPMQSKLYRNIAVQVSQSIDNILDDPAQRE